MEQERGRTKKQKKNPGLVIMKWHAAYMLLRLPLCLLCGPVAARVLIGLGYLPIYLYGTGYEVVFPALRIAIVAALLVLTFWKRPRNTQDTRYFIIPTIYGCVTVLDTILLRWFAVLTHQ